MGSFLYRQFNYFRSWWVLHGNDTGTIGDIINMVGDAGIFRLGAPHYDQDSSTVAKHPDRAKALMKSHDATEYDTWSCAQDIAL